MFGEPKAAPREQVSDDEPERPAAAGGEPQKLPPELADGAAVLKAAKLVCRADEEVCLIRKVGPGWMVAETYAVVSAGDAVLIVVGDDLSVSGNISWTGEGRVGVSFASDLDLDALLAASRAVRGGRQPRMPRVKLDAWARLRVGARVFSVHLRNISQGGARIQVHGLLPATQQAVLTVRDLAPMDVMIRWSGENEAGLSFNQPLGFAELAAWLASRRPSGPEHGGRPPEPGSGLRLCAPPPAPGGVLRGGCESLGLD